MRQKKNTPEADKARHWLARAYLTTSKPSRALSTAEAGLKGDVADVVRHNLLLDKADALAALPNQYSDSFVAYAESFAEAKLPVLTVRALQGMLDVARTDEQYKYLVDVAHDALNSRSEKEIVVGAKVAIATASMNLDKPAETARMYRELLNEYGDHPAAIDWRMNAAWSMVLNEQHDDALVITMFR